MAVNNLWVCNMAEMTYKVENKFPFQSTARDVETREQNDKHSLTNEKYTGHWHTLVLNRNILDKTVTYTKCELFKVDWLYI